jgi:hypothetical protein
VRVCAGWLVDRGNASVAWMEALAPITPTPAKRRGRSFPVSRGARRAPSVMNALASYDKRWRPFARRMQQTAAMLQRLCGIERVRTLRVRDALLAGLAQFPRMFAG